MLPDLRRGRGYGGVAGVQQQPVRTGRAVRCRGGRRARQWDHAARYVAECRLAVRGGRATGRASLVDPILTFDLTGAKRDHRRQNFLGPEGPLLN
eukprot:COSAG01_NODE_7632_length_3120_cov_7.847733_5_plen_95_part_00